jgi:peroxiredoxin
MKKSVNFLLVILVLVSCTSMPHYTVKGKIAGSDSIMFYLQKRDDGKTVTIDSAISRKGVFTMKGGVVGFPQMIQLVAGKTRKRTAFYLENSEITITGNLDSLFSAKITGSKTQDQYNTFIESNKPLSDVYSKLYEDYKVARKANNAVQITVIEREADSIQKEMMKLQLKFVRDNPASYITPNILASISSDLEPQELESVINALDTSIAVLPQIMILKDRVLAMKAVSAGQKAPDFTMNDPEDKPVTLSSKIGPRLLLIDFWASWCGPCRQENPNVVKVYNEFHKKGFDIFGVSLDQKKEDWVKAISDDKLAWTHVSDLKYWGNDAARLYAVNQIPSNFLLDDKGIIIGTNLRGDDLYKKVKDILDKK